MIQSLLTLSAQIKTQKLPIFKRFLYDNIDFNEQLIGIIGSRGVGKTTILLQYLKENLSQKTLYIIADHPSVINHGLFNIANEFQKMGGEVLIIDEIHKIKNFEIELKLIYDSFFELKVIFTGSNAVAINNAKADLSRRVVIYKLPVLSFREFLELETKIHLKSYSLDEILSNHEQIAIEVNSTIKPFEYFNKYLTYGAYPFYIKSKKSFNLKLLNSSMQVLETDLTAIYDIGYDKINALKKMIMMICMSEPFDINIFKLCGAVELNQRTLYKYLWILQSAGLIRILGAKTNGVSVISKPEKLYLDNTNLFSVFCNTPKIGTMRETFFYSMVSYFHDLDYPKSGDFIIDEIYTIEIGGKGKDFKQLKNVKNGFVVADDIEVGYGDKIPLWLFGFMY
ncbi:MAG: ATP-binding protein [Sulfurovum sp.]|nr:MAG: ATP-binding protein [Sulfurovum sp.]